MFVFLLLSLIEGIRKFLHMVKLWIALGWIRGFDHSHRTVCVDAMPDTHSVPSAHDQNPPAVHLQSQSSHIYHLPSDLPSDFVYVTLKRRPKRFRDRQPLGSEVRSLGRPLVVGQQTGPRVQSPAPISKRKANKRSPICTVRCSSCHATLAEETDSHKQEALGENPLLETVVGSLW